MTRAGRFWLLLLVAAAPAAGHRHPAPGGQLTVSLPAALIRATVDAHVFAPVVEPAVTGRVRDRVAHPSLDGWPAWRSGVVTRIDKSADLKTWTLVPRDDGDRLGRAVALCLGALGTSNDWPALALAGAGVRVEVETTRKKVTLRFTKPVGPVPDLLSGCLLRGPQATGAYVALTGGELRRREGAPLGPPLLSRIVFRAPGSPAELSGGDPDQDFGSTLFAPFPDMVLLLQAETARTADPLGLQGKETGRLAAFRSELNPDMLSGIFWNGRGGEAVGILPPGLAPARPLPEPTGLARPLTLALDDLEPNAPTLRMHRVPGDPLVDGTVDRLALMLRTRGLRLVIDDPVPGPLMDGVEVIRWRPATLDPALAVLQLAGQYPEVLARDTSVADKLLSPDAGERLAAALLIETTWLEDRKIVPLLWAERWVSVDSDLRGLKLRPDGVPLLSDAHWGQAR